MEAVEYVDPNALALLDDEAFNRAGLPRPTQGSTLLIVQLEAGPDAQPALETLGGLLDSLNDGQWSITAAATTEPIWPPVFAPAACISRWFFLS